MSNCSRSSGTRSPRDASCSIRSRHIRRLNFGRSILELDVVERRRVTTGRGLVIDDDGCVTRIPCTEKRDYVRKWLETHGNGDVTTSDDLPQSSVVLGTSREKSPILGNSRKRPRIYVNRRDTARGWESPNCQTDVGHPANSTILSDLDYESKERNDNEQDHPSKVQCTPPCTERLIARKVSPVLNTHRTRKRSRRKLQYEQDNSVSPKHLKLYDSEIVSANTIPVAKPDDNYSILREIIMDHDKLGENVDVPLRTTLFSYEVEKSSKKFQNFREMFSSPMREKANFEDSSSSSTTMNNSIQTDTSNGSKDEECDKLTSNNNSTNSSNNNLNNLIEDTDTQETDTKIYPMLDKYLTSSRQQITSSQLAAENLDETYCSEAEIIQDQSIHLSAKISQVLSLSKTNNKSTQIVSTLTTPSKKSPDKDVNAYLLDSGKKRRKPKKGSMVAKLQSLVSSQISDIRIWRHRMNQGRDTVSTRFISVFVRNYTKQFGNQFLEGILIEDRFDLLQNNTDVEGTELRIPKEQPKEQKDITIVLVNNIVGSLKMISEVVINVYPPWTVLNKDNLTLEAMYITISKDQEVPDIRNKNDTDKCEKRIVKEFNCPCIEEQRELPFCARKPTGEKPDVMQQIFDF